MLSAKVSKFIQPGKEEGKGTGLGLSMVIGSAHHAGGVIEVESVVGALFAPKPNLLPIVIAYAAITMDDSACEYRQYNISG